MSGRFLERALSYVDHLAAEAQAASRPICLDTTAVIAYLTSAQPVAPLIERLIEDPGLPIVVSTITLAEAVGRPAMRGDRRRDGAIHAALLASPALSIVDLDQRHAIATADVRAATGLRLPDAAIVATARLAQASALLGNDRQWRLKPLGVPYHHIDDILAPT